ncbi:acyltransferase family protein [Lysobacter arvi]|nr:acyltransferase [Lysobacter arvi]
MNPIRNDWADIAKGIGIMLVVYGHVARGVMSAKLGSESEVLRIADDVIYSFHMPLFFFLSGLFFQSSFVARGRLGMVENKVQTILYPYVVWSLLQGGVEVLLSKYTNGGATLSELATLAWQPRAQLWFLYVLFLVFALAVLLYPRRRFGTGACILIALIGAIAFVWSDLIPDVWVLVRLSTSFVFFSVGVLFSKYERDLPEVNWWGISFMLLLFALCQMLTINHSLQRVSAWMLFVSLLGTMCVVVMSKRIAVLQPRWLVALGAASMAIYLMHILAGSGTRIVLSKVFGIESVSVHLALGTAVGLTAPLLADKMIKRFRLTFLYVAPIPSRGQPPTA